MKRFIILMLIGMDVLIGGILRTDCQLLCAAENKSYPIWTPETLPVPANTTDKTKANYVSNPDSILSKAEVDVINAMLVSLEEEKGVRTLVICVGNIDPDDPFTFTMQTANLHGVGDERDMGLVIMLATQSRGISILTGSGLEKYLPNSKCEDIQVNILTPLCKEGKWGEGMVSTVRELCQFIKGIEELEPATETVLLNNETNSNWLYFLVAGGAILLILVFVLFGRKKEKTGNTVKQAAIHSEVANEKRNFANKADGMFLGGGSYLQAGKYKILSVLGEGGFGITYLGEQVHLGRKVAIKEFYMKDFCERDATTSDVRTGVTSNTELVGRCKQKFLKEARLIASFDHPHIVHVYDVFEENGTAYYVMEYVAGKSLKEIIGQSPMPNGESLRIIREVANALDYVHNRNILHLDVKPANILLQQNGSVVLIDFGISKRYDQQGEQTTSTPVGCSKGYAPLEQYNQAMSNFTAATDIYALGATLYTMLTGAIPPEASIVNEEGVTSISSLPIQFRPVVEASMQPVRKNRPQTIAEFLCLLPASDNANTIASADGEETKIIY